MRQGGFLPSLTQFTVMVSSHTYNRVTGATHDLCHLPTCQCQEEFVVKSNVQPEREEDVLVPRSVHLPLNHSTQFVLLSLLHAEKVKSVGCMRQHRRAGTLVDQDFYFILFFFKKKICSALFFVLSIAIFHSLQVKCKHAP